jgi:hypothetical protein
VGNDFDLTIELEGYTKADISDLMFDGFIALYGVIPSQESLTRQQTQKPLTHGEKDRRLHILSRKLAKAIEQDTSLLWRSKEHIDRLLKEDQGTASGDLMEWRDILNMYSIQRLCRFLTSTSERANRLRQSNPFFAILTLDERAQLVSDLEDKIDT